MDEGVQPAAQPLMSESDRAAQAAQRRRSRVQDLAARIDAGLQADAQGRHWVEAPVQRMEQRPLHLAQRVGQATGRHEGLDDGPQLPRVEATPAHGTRHDGTDVPCAADADVRPHGEQPAGLVGLVEAARHDERVRRRLDEQGEPSGRLERRVRGQARTDERELEQLRGASVHQPARLNGPLSEACPAMPNRHGRMPHSAPA